MRRRGRLRRRAPRAATRTGASRSVGLHPASDAAQHRSAGLGQQTGSIRSSTVTGFGTRLSSVMKSIDFCQSAASMAPRPRASCTGPLQTAIVASRMAACVSRSAARSGTAVSAASRPFLRVVADVLHGPQRRGDERRDRVALHVERFAPTISPLPGQWRDLVDAQDVHSSPVSCNWTGSLLAKPVAASTAPCATAAP